MVREASKTAFRKKQKTKPYVYILKPGSTSKTHLLEGIGIAVIFSHLPSSFLLWGEKKENEQNQEKKRSNSKVRV